MARMPRRTSTRTDAPDSTMKCRRRRWLGVGALTTLAATAALIVVLPAGGAESGDERSVRAAIDRHTKALADGDAAAVCTSITLASRQTFADIGGSTCEAAVAATLRDFDGMFDDRGLVGPLTIRGNVARGTQRWAATNVTEPITVRRERGCWLVDVREPQLR